MTYRPEEAYTNFYNVLTIKKVKYSVFVSSKHEERDQSLLEAELHMRNTYNTGLFFQANKELWSFGLNEEEPPIPLEKFNLKCKETDIFLPQDIILSNKSAKSLDSNSKSKYSNILYTILLSSIKKKILINLSMKNYITPFGKASIVTPVGSINMFSEFIYIDPQIFANGDVLISIATKSTSIIALSILSKSSAKSLLKISNNTHILFLAPSGTRAYFANNTLAESLTQMPSNNQNLLIMLHLLIGIVFNKKLHEIKWIKLIPDLKHLNGLTPQISKFIKPVQNYKFVIWPLDLCFIQKCDTLRYPKSNFVGKNPYDSVSLFNRIYELTDEIKSIKLQQQKKQDVLNRAVINENTKKKFDAKRVILNKNNEGLDSSNICKNNENNNIENPLEITEKGIDKGDDIVDDDDIDNFESNWDKELFGENKDGGDVSDTDFNFFDDYSNDEAGPAKSDTKMSEDPQISNNNIDLEIPEPQESKEIQNESNVDPIKIDVSQESPNDRPTYEQDQLSNLNSDQTLKIQQTEFAFDIPKSEMCIPSIPYADPGAPLPIAVTPGISSSSVFSPLKFNPVIRDTVDTKYDKGGKFYVPESSQRIKDLLGTSANDILNKNIGILTSSIKSPVIDNNERLKVVVDSEDEDLTSDSESEDDVKDNEYDDDDDDEDAYQYENDRSATSAGNNHNLQQDIGINQFETQYKTISMLQPNILEMRNDTNADLYLDSYPENSKPANEDSGIASIDIAKVETDINFQSMSTPDLPQAKMFSHKGNNSVTPNVNNVSPVAANTPPTPGKVNKNTESIRYHDLSNWIPFLTKTNPLCTIPNIVFLNNPIIIEKDLNDLLPILMNILLYDNNLLDNYLLNPLGIQEEPLKSFSEYNYLDTLIAQKSSLNDIAGEITMLDFCTYYDDLDSDESYSSDNDTNNNLSLVEGRKNIINAIKGLFNCMKRVKLSEYIGITRLISNDDNINSKDSLMSSFISNIDTDFDLDDIMMADSNILLSELNADQHSKSILETTHAPQQPEELQEYVFSINTPSFKVKRMDQLLTMNSASMKLWNILSLSPVYGKRNIKFLIIVNDTKHYMSSHVVKRAQILASSVSQQYKGMNLGSADFVNGADLIESVTKKLKESSNKEMTRLLDQLSKRFSRGVLNISYNGSNSNEYYALIDKILKLVMIGFDTDDSCDSKLMIFFSNQSTNLKFLINIAEIQKSLNSFVQINIKSWDNKFKKSAKDGINSNLIGKNNLPLVQIIPKESYIADEFTASPTTEFYRKLAFSMYNSVNSNKDFLHSQITSSIPRKIEFSLTKENRAKSILKEDLYLHLAYERSSDKNWCVASWTDQWGKRQKVKSWYTYPVSNFSKSNNGKFTIKDGVRKTFEQAANEMWSETSKLIGNYSGKSYLVLTRLNGIILDDELIHWKRLSARSKFCIILLTVNSNPLLILNDSNLTFPFTRNEFFQKSKYSESADINDYFKLKDATKAVNSYRLEEVNDSELTIENGEESFFGIILKNSIPLSNFANKITFKTGYLVKPSKDERSERLLTFEVNLLSYPGYFEPNKLLKELLQQYRNLVAVKSLLGNYNLDISSANNSAALLDKTDDVFNQININHNSVDNSSIIPWNVMAVKKVLNTIVHIRVE